MYNFLIYDDDPKAGNKYAEYLKNISDELMPGIPIEVRYADRKEDALKMIDDQTEILFCDIDLEDNINGIDFSNEIAKDFPDLNIVFLTAYNQFSQDIFKADPVDFILKPATKERFLECIKRIEKKKQDKHIFIYHNRGKKTAVPVDSVYYIDASDQHIALIAENKKVIVTGHDNKIIEDLPNSFCRINKSLYVNILKVKSKKMETLTLIDDVVLNISLPYRKSADKTITTFLQDSVI